MINDYVSPEYYDEKWKRVISDMPSGGDYNFPKRQYGYNIITSSIPEESKVFDYACGLAVIDIYLQTTKKCQISGCDMSKVAVDYASSKVKGDFRTTIDFFGGPYDFIIATYLIEHLQDPFTWMATALRHAPKVICSIPDNFRKSGEHIYMAWGSMNDFLDKFKAFNPVCISSGKYPKDLQSCYQHHTFMFSKENK